MGACGKDTFPCHHDAFGPGGSGNRGALDLKSKKSKEREKLRQGHHWN